MKSKTKPVIFAVLLSLVIVVVAVYFLKGTTSTEKAVKIVDYGSSICTQDIPSSDCGPYDVAVQTADGQKITYKVAGFSNRNSKLYDDLTPKITRAKEQKTQVSLKVNKKGEIISVQ